MKNRMVPIPFETLLLRCLAEYRESKSLFYVPVEPLAAPFVSPIGPAAGPHTQMAQNIVAAWAAGARHFELKTVQVLEGEALGIAKPCIAMDGGVYNTEWSTELTVAEARDEYVKAWYLIHLLTRELSLEASGLPVFYMSVGYDLEGIKSSKVNGFIDAMKDASACAAWRECEAMALKHVGEFRNLKEAGLESVPPAISGSVTLSTLHGCPAAEIEDIARHLLGAKGLDVFLKMNPTLLGRERVAELLAGRGFDPERLKDDSFSHDISFADATAMLRRLLAYAKASGRVLGVKLTNTLPVASRGELSGETLYLSGSLLRPLATGVAALLAGEFGGGLPLSYSGGADRSNVAALAGAGLFPVTVSSALLAPGGYRNLTFMNRALAEANRKPRFSANGSPAATPRSAASPYPRVDAAALAALAAGDRENPAPVRLPRAARRAITLPATETPPGEPDECGRCSNCVDVCPNRANVPYTVNGARAVRHDGALCNECGACVFLCVEGRTPWRDKKEIDRKENIS